MLIRRQSLDCFENVLALDSLSEPEFLADCRAELEANGALVVKGFFSASAVDTVVSQSEAAESRAFYTGSTHNVYLTATDSSLDSNHPFNRQVVSSKGLIADDQIPNDSPLKAVYDAPEFREFLCSVLDIPEIHPYADSLSSVNVHFAPHGKELGWHFDNSSFAVTMLLQAPESGGVFEYVANVRNADAGEMGFDQVEAILDGKEPVSQLKFSPGDLVLFRGRNSIHRVTPTIGDTTRMLVVFAYNSEPGIGLSESALNTFYGRIS